MLSQKTRYTIRALQHLADCWRQGPVRLDTIAEAQNIPRKFLTVILSEMVREGLVISHRGRDGGYELGLPPVGRSRTTGLRREDVAYLSGVSVTWYTWLEQGRDIHPSRQVLDALARTLWLSGTEHGYLLSLAGYSAPQLDTAPSAEAAPAHVQRLIDALAGCPG